MMILFITLERNLNYLLEKKLLKGLKFLIGSALDLGSNQEMKVKGRDLTRGLPKEIKIKEDDIREAITPSLNKIFRCN